MLQFKDALGKRLWLVSPFAFSSQVIAFLYLMGKGCDILRKATTLEKTRIYFISAVKTLHSCFRVLLRSYVGRDNCYRASDLIIRDWSESLLSYIHCTPVIKNPDGVDFPGCEPLIFMSNHTSLYDIPVLFRAIPGSLRMVAKKEIKKIPFFGKTLEVLGFIYIDRKNHTRAIQDLDRARKTMRSGVMIWISPEGTRSANGKVGKLKKGGFKLAQKTGARIVPVSIAGANGILQDGVLSGLHLNVPVAVTIHKPLDPKDYQNENGGEKALIDAVGRLIDPNSDANCCH